MRRRGRRRRRKNKSIDGDGDALSGLRECMNYLCVTYQTMTVRKMFSDTAGSKSIFVRYDPAFL